MRDPEPQNIHGEKVQKHVFKHEINWGYVVLGLVALFALVKFGPPVVSSVGDDDDETAGSGGDSLF